MKFGICNEIFKDWKIDDVFTYCADRLRRRGGRAVHAGEIRYRDPRRQSGRGFASPRRAPSIEISGIHWVLVQAEGMYVTSPDAAHA